MMACLVNARTMAVSVIPFLMVVKGWLQVHQYVMTIQLSKVEVNEM